MAVGVTGSAVSAYENARRKILDLFRIAEMELAKLVADDDYKHREHSVVRSVPRNAHAKIVLESRNMFDLIVLHRLGEGVVQYMPSGVGIESIDISFDAYPYITVSLKGEFCGGERGEIVFESLHYLLGYLYYTGDLYRLATGDVVEEGDPAVLSLVKTLSALIVQAENYGGELVTKVASSVENTRKTRIPIVEVGSLVATRQFGNVYFALVKRLTSSEPEIHLKVHTSDVYSSEFVTYCNVRSKHARRDDFERRRFSLELLTNSYAFSLLYTAVHRKLEPAVAKLLRGFTLADLAVRSYEEVV